MLKTGEQRVEMVSLIGVTEQSRRLVHQDNVLILVNYIELVGRFHKVVNIVLGSFKELVLYI